jgi:OmpA-OmpF porin, OOP family
MKLRNTLLGASLLAAPMLAAPLAAKAQPVTGLYVALGVGANWLMDQKVGTASSNIGEAGHKLTYDTGEVGVGSIGWGLGNGFRVELEGNFRNNGLDQFHGTPFPTSGSGQFQSYGAMVNALYDFDVGFNWMYPYIGVGAGWAHNKADDLEARGTTVPYFMRTGGENDNFAYQAIAGVAFPMPWVPGLSATVEYRFFSEPNPGGFNRGVFAAQPFPNGSVQKISNKLDIDNTYNHSVLIGLRYAFNTAPPPPPPAPPVVAAPAPQPARSYLVFFDWDRADLTDRARQVISEAAQASTRVQVTRIEVNGYTDTSGTPQYNQGLSIRRARAVQAELVRDGVPGNAIDIHGYGETHLLVPTGPGVREPQNRRVEIILH